MSTTAIVWFASESVIYFNRPLPGGKQRSGFGHETKPRYRGAWGKHEVNLSLPASYDASSKPEGNVNQTCHAAPHGGNPATGKIAAEQAGSIVRKQGSLDLLLEIYEDNAVIDVGRLRRAGQTNQAVPNLRPRFP